jgi:hypothetical protein
MGPQGSAGVGVFHHYIGEKFGGGVVFHLWKDSLGVEHGLIVGLSNLSDSHIWNTHIVYSGSFWDGLKNSITIVNSVWDSQQLSAAALCINSNNNGQTDWYLPSIDELNLMWLNRFNVNKTLSGISGATVLPNWNSYYWSSTSLGYSAGDSMRIFFGTGSNSTNTCTNNCSIRAIRSF